MTGKARIGLATAAAALLSVGLLSAGLLSGCDDAEPRATGAPMGGAPSSTGAVNEPPRIQSVRLEPASPRPGDEVFAQVEAADPEGDPVHLFYRWRVNGRPVDGGASIHLDAVAKEALVEVEVVARDASGESPTVTARTRVGNGPPVLLGIVIEPLGAVTRDHAVVARPQARDPENDELEMSYRWWVNGRPVDADGASLPSDRFQRGDRIELEVVASDGSSESEPLRSQAFEVENAPPRIVSKPRGFDADGIFRYALAGEDADGDTKLQFHLIEGPSGMEIDRKGSVLTWRPSRRQTGKHPVVLEVEDSQGGTGRQEFSLDLAFGQPPAAPGR